MSLKINLQLLLSGTVARPCITRATPCSRYSRRWLMRYWRKTKAPPSFHQAGPVPRSGGPDNSRSVDKPTG